MYNDILVATDGSEQSAQSVEHGLGLAEAFGAHVHVLYVIETKATYILNVGLGEEEMEEYEKYGEETVSDIANRAAERGLDATGVVRTGSIAAEIDDYAVENGLDLIVTGRQGRGAIERYLGSTAEKVARMSNVPVTIVGPGAK